MATPRIHRPSRRVCKKIPNVSSNHPVKWKFVDCIEFQEKLANESNSKGERLDEGWRVTGISKLLVPSDNFVDRLKSDDLNALTQWRCLCKVSLRVCTQRRTFDLKVFNWLLRLCKRSFTSSTELICKFNLNASRKTELSGTCRVRLSERTHLEDHISGIVHPKILWRVSSFTQLNSQTLLEN